MKYSKNISIKQQELLLLQVLQVQVKQQPFIPFSIHSIQEKPKLLP
jgi:hypothetical protein